MQPSLPDVVANKVKPQQMSEDLHKLIPNDIEYKQENITRIDPETQTVQTTENVYAYDYLILATGSITDFDNLPGKPEDAYGLTSLKEAKRLQKDFKSYLNEEENPVVVISGGGYTGFELAFNLRYLAEQLGKSPKIIIAEKSDQVLNILNEPMRKTILSYAEEEAIEVKTRTFVKDVKSGTVDLSTGEMLENAFLCWAVGTKFAVNFSGKTVRRLKDGRIIVNAFLQIPSYKNVFAVGDSAAIIGKGGKFLRKAVNFSIYSGEHAAKNIAKLIKKHPVEMFKPFDLGWIIPMHKESVGYLFGHIPISGYIGVRLHYFMSSFRNYTLSNSLSFMRLAVTPLKKEPHKMETIKSQVNNAVSTVMSATTDASVTYMLFRVFIGGGMMYHGIGKLTGDIAGFTTYIASLNIPFAELMSYAAISAEVLGGLFLMLGLLTRFSAFFIAVTMAVAAFVAHGGMPFAEKELALLYLVPSIMFIFKGGGKYSLDYLLNRLYCMSDVRIYPLLSCCAIDSHK